MSQQNKEDDDIEIIEFNEEDKQQHTPKTPKDRSRASKRKLTTPTSSSSSSNTSKTTTPSTGNKKTKLANQSSSSATPSLQPPPTPPPHPASDTTTTSASAAGSDISNNVLDKSRFTPGFLFKMYGLHDEEKVLLKFSNFELTPAVQQMFAFLTEYDGPKFCLPLEFVQSKQIMKFGPVFFSLAFVDLCFSLTLEELIDLYNKIEGKRASIPLIFVEILIQIIRLSLLQADQTAVTGRATLKLNRFRNRNLHVSPYLENLIFTKKNNCLENILPIKCQIYQSILNILYKSLIVHFKKQNLPQYYDANVMKRSNNVVWMNFARDFLKCIVFSNKIVKSLPIILKLRRMESFETVVVKYSCRGGGGNKPLEEIHIHREVFEFNTVFVSSDIVPQLNEAYNFPNASKNDVEKAFDLLYCCFSPDPSIMINLAMGSVLYKIKAQGLLQNFLQRSVEWKFYDPYTLIKMELCLLKTCEDFDKAAKIVSKEKLHWERVKFVKGLPSAIITSLFSSNSFDLTNDEKYALLIEWCCLQHDVICQNPFEVVADNNTFQTFLKVYKVLDIKLLKKSMLSTLAKQKFIPKQDLDNI